MVRPGVQNPFSCLLCLLFLLSFRMPDNEAKPAAADRLSAFCFACTNCISWLRQEYSQWPCILTILHSTILLTYHIGLSHQQLTRVLVTSQTWDVTPASIGKSVRCRLLQRDTYTDCHAIRIQSGWSGCCTGNRKKVSSSRPHLGQATYMAVA